LRCPAGLLEEILEARSFAATKLAIDRATRPEDQPKGAMADLVRSVIESNAEEDIERAAADDAGE
jgi:hypothetical protein